MKILRNKICSAILLIILSFLLSARADALSPWIVDKGEKVITGTYDGYEKNRLYLTTKDKRQTLIMENNPIIAIMGPHSGTLMGLDELPQGVDIEVFMNKEGKARALRNRQEKIKEISGIPLAVWGHGAFISPDNRKFLLYHFHDGLSLHDININNSSPPFYLSSLPVYSWNKDGKKLAYATKNGLSILELNTEKITEIPFKAEKADLIKVVTGITWSPEEKRLLVTSLDDVPNTGSDLFTLTILDLEGKLLIHKAVPCLGQVFWLNQDEILLATFSDISMKTAHIQLWNIKDDTFHSLLKHENLTNLTYNPLQKILAFSVKSGIREDIFTYCFEQNKLDKKASLLSSIQNLQWSSNNTLFFWQELNNTICELTQDNKVKIHFSGYLPPNNAIRDKILYFLSEPLEESQQVYIQKIQ